MGKHETGYTRVERDFYPTREPWVVAALAEHVDLRGLTIWEHACGDGHMVEPLLLAGCARVYASDIIDRGAGQDEVLDYLSGREPKLPHYDGMITNPPFGARGALAAAFIEAGLKRIKEYGGFLALLLPCDFDSAKTRACYFGDCPHFVGKIVLRQRIVWFKRDDGGREQPKENSAWFLWARSLLRVRRPPIIIYAPINGESPR
jgi:hypothetical protein